VEIILKVDFFVDQDIVRIESEEGVICWICLQVELTVNSLSEKLLSSEGGYH